MTTLGRPRSVMIYFVDEIDHDEGSGPVSRVLSRTAIYLELQSPAASSAQPGRTAGRPYGVPICVCSRWGLPSCVVTDALVRFYHTVSAFRLPGAHWAGIYAFRARLRRIKVARSPFKRICSAQCAPCGAKPHSKYESSFLWHFPSGCPVQPLAGILPWGARTFLA